VGGNPHCFSLSFDLFSSILVLISRKCLLFKFRGALSYIVPDLHRPLRYCVSGHIGDNVSFMFGGEVNISICYFYYLCGYFYCFCALKKIVMLLIKHDYILVWFAYHWFV